MSAGNASSTVMATGGEDVSLHRETANTDFIDSDRSLHDPSVRFKTRQSPSADVLGIQMIAANIIDTPHFLYNQNVNPEHNDENDTSEGTVPTLMATIESSEVSEVSHITVSKASADRMCELSDDEPCTFGPQMTDQYLSTSPNPKHQIHTEDICNDTDTKVLSNHETHPIENTLLRESECFTKQDNEYQNSAGKSDLAVATLQNYEVNQIIGKTLPAVRPKREYEEKSLHYNVCKKLSPCTENFDTSQEALENHYHSPLAPQISNDIYQSALQGQNAFDPEKIFCLRLHLMNEYTQKVMYQVFLWGTKDNKNMNVTLEDYLIIEKKMTKLHYRGIFDKVQREKIRSNPSGDTFDITLLYRSIQHACTGMATPRSPEWITEGDTLEFTLTSLKKFRNDLKHEAFRISKSVFLQRVEELRKLLVKTLKLAGELYSVEVSTVNGNIQYMNDTLNSIRDTPVAPTSERLLKYLQSELKVSGKEEIRKFYEQFSNFNPVSFLTGEQMFLNVGLIFTRIDVTDYAKGNSQDESCAQTIEYENLLSYGGPTGGRLNRIRLLEGPGGSGKTTLMRKMMHDWLAGDSSMADLLSHDLLLYMECRDTTNSSFAQLLDSLMPETAKKFNREDFVKCALGIKLLIIVDGIDELNESSTALFKEILCLQKKHDITLFYTTRPEKVEDVYKLLPDSQETSHLKIIGISEDQREEFATKYHEEMRKLGKSNEDTEGLIEYLRTTGARLQEHWRLPLNLVLLTILWAIASSRVNFVTTATELYLEIYKLTIEKLLERLKTKEKTQLLSVSELRDRIEIFAVRLCCEALRGLKNDEINLSDKARVRLEDICRECDLPVDDTTGAFLVKKNIWTQTGMLTKVSYPHKGFQDFLSAVCILLKLKTIGVNLNTTNIIQNTQSTFMHPTQLKSRGFFQKLFRRKLTLKKIKHRCFCKRKENNPLKRWLFSSLLNQFSNVNEQGTSIAKLLQVLHDEDGSEIHYYKYNNVFVHLTALLHMCSEGSIDMCLVMELVTSLRKSGIRKREQWLDLLSNVKCDESVAKVIVNSIQNIYQDETTVEDIRVYSYVSLFQNRCPESVNLNITAKVQDIPRLEELLYILGNNECVIHELNFHYDFQHPERALGSLDEALSYLFTKCKVNTFRGVLSDKLDPVIPTSMKKLRVGVWNKEQYAVIQRFLTSKGVSLRRFALHVSVSIDHTQLEALPMKNNVHLYLSDVDPGSLYKACDIIKALHGVSTRGFATLLLPRCKLGVSDFENLIEELDKLEVRVSNPLCTSANVPEEFLQGLQNVAMKKLRTGFVLMAEAEIWKKW
ncbi:hypothetical protein SK128_002285 [Halocaridina rubra]|uniref:NACHT domain-containing protein n=1 Tax=Halocaridina rubra TaxID=373956 RepID=A0AAN8XCJ1_HALRR